VTYPTIGPLSVPSSPSGVHFPSCTHQAPQSCPRCDGSSSPERPARTRLTRAAWLASLPPLTRALVEGHPTHAEEASA
jgi:hypothetical protein